VFKRYELAGVVSHVKGHPTDSEGDGHLVCHVPAHLAALKTKEQEPEAAKEWVVFNDFAVSYCSREDAVNFHEQPWREPCLLIFRELVDSDDDVHGNDQSGGGGGGGGGRCQELICPSVFDAPSLSLLPTHLQLPPTFQSLPRKGATQPQNSGQSSAKGSGAGGAGGDGSSSSSGGGATRGRRRLLPQLPLASAAIAIDTEFVSVAEEDIVMNADGRREVRGEARQALSRVSAVLSTSATGQGHEEEESEVVLIDDYVVPTEAIVDYKTRFSGLTMEDLDVHSSPHHLVSHRTTFLKLRCLADRGCFFVGHGLKTDFRVANLFVPPTQVLDTLDLWSLPAQRKLSLRFLAGCVLGSNIQGETHDSIEDARTALHLWERYRDLALVGAATDFSLPAAAAAAAPP